MKLFADSSQMRVYFYASKPKEIPRTHQFRKIEFKDFEPLILRVERPIIVEASYQEFVLYTLFGINSDVHQPKDGQAFPLPKLGKDDLGVVIDNYGVEIFGDWIAPRSKLGIAERAVFGVIEPKLD